MSPSRLTEPRAACGERPRLIRIARYVARIHRWPRLLPHLSPNLLRTCPTRIFSPFSAF